MSSLNPHVDAAPEVALPPAAKPVRKSPRAANSQKAPLDVPRIFESYEQAHTEFDKMFCYVRSTNAVVRLSDSEVFAPQTFASMQYVNWAYEVQKKDDDGKVTKTYHQVARKWLRDGRRKQCDRMTFAPGQPRFLPNGDLNRWKGLASIPKEGDIGPWKELVEFLFPDSVARKHFEQWLAYPLQRLGAKLKTAVVLYSREQGIGKNILVEAVELIYGNNAHEIGEKELHGNFNSWLKDRQFIVGDEVQGGDKKRDAAERLKRLITAPFVELNEKYKPEYVLPNVANFIFLTNNPDPFYIAAEDRRFWIWEIPQTVPLPDEFYLRFHEWKDSAEGIAALHWHLLRVDTSDFNPDAKAPMTDGKSEMIELGRSEIERWLRELPNNRKCTLYTSRDLVKRWREENDKSSASEPAILRALKTCGYQKAHGGKQVKVKGKQLYLWVVTSPEEADRLHAAEPSELAAEYEKWNPIVP